MSSTWPLLITFVRWGMACGNISGQRYIVEECLKLGHRFSEVNSSSTFFQVGNPTPGIWKTSNLASYHSIETRDNDRTG